MRVPIRKGDERIFANKDYYLTKQRYQAIELEITRLKEYRPKLAVEVKRLAEMGDFSENAGYQMAKGKIRGLNQRLLNLEDQLKKAEIIEISNDLSLVQIGHTVKLKIDSKHKTYTILGASESDPKNGIISHLSPLGSALLGKKEGDTVMIKNNKYKIIEIDK
ncbi:MAG: transcription elongation factor GreA [Clostridia bacterium]|nr:transcription elongation factor GreA [Clostridia bacterium]